MLSAVIIICCANAIPTFFWFVCNLTIVIYFTQNYIIAETWTSVWTLWRSNRTPYDIIIWKNCHRHFTYTQNSQHHYFCFGIHLCAYVCVRVFCVCACVLCVCVCACAYACACACVCVCVCVDVTCVCVCVCVCVCIITSLLLLMYGCTSCLCL